VVKVKGRVKERNVCMYRRQGGRENYVYFCGEGRYIYVGRGSVGVEGV
jgi:hypothetical protein